MRVFQNREQSPGPLPYHCFPALSDDSSATRSESIPSEPIQEGTRCALHMVNFLHTVGCTSDLCVLPPTPMLLGQDLCHVRTAVLVSKLLICRGIVAGSV